MEHICSILRDNIRFRVFCEPFGFVTVERCRVEKFVLK